MPPRSTGPSPSCPPPGERRQTLDPDTARAWDDIESGAVEEILDRDFEKEVDRYRQVTPGAVAGDALDTAGDVSEEILERVPAPQPILPISPWKLIG